ncbi:MAG TPA: hypothetical protein VIL42_01240 [Sphingomicrobium sp.]|jgi:hypothetical protein
MRRPLIVLSVLVVPAAVAVAQPSALTQVAGGLWEVSGAPGARAPVRVCVGQALMLAQFEHRGGDCKRTVVGNTAGSTVINYSCGGAGFGHSRIDVITPRSLRIDTQGISNQLPFAYVLQAHRVGDCGKSASSSRH